MFFQWFTLSQGNILIPFLEITLKSQNCVCLGDWSIGKNLCHANLTKIKSLERKSQVWSTETRILQFPLRQLSLLHTIVSAFIPIPCFFCYCRIPSWNGWNQVFTLLKKIFWQKELRTERILTLCPHYSPICREIKTASTWKSWSHPEHPNLHPWDSAEESFVSVEQKIRDSLSPLASYGITNCFLTGNQQGKQGIDIEKNGLKGKELHTLESAWTL